MCSTHTHGAREVRFRLALFPVSQSAPIVLHNDRRYRWLWPIVTAVINRCVFIAKAGSATTEHTVATSNVTTAVPVKSLYITRGMRYLQRSVNFLLVSSLGPN